MATPHESAQLILRLYELRREPVMRQGRAWFLGFDPSGADDVMRTQQSEDSASYRMVTSYWEMAAAMVLGNAIDETMFQAQGNEPYAVYAKLESFLDDLRAKIGDPSYLQNLETLAKRHPAAPQLFERLRARTLMIAGKGRP